MAERPQMTKIVLILVLTAVLTVVLLRQFGIGPFASGKGTASTTPAKDKGAGKAASAGKVEPAKAPTVEVAWKRPDPVGPLARDPTQLDVSKAAPVEATGTAEPTEPEFRVAGIIYSTEQPSSIIIDGRILHEGDTIHEAVVLKITAEWAMLQRGEKVWQIRAGQTNKPPEKPK